MMTLGTTGNITANGANRAGDRQNPTLSPAGRAASPQFSGALLGARLAASDGMVSTFQKIVEVFLWAFLAQDVAGMWLARIGVALKRGRTPYDPANDPQASQQPFHKQIGLWASKNIQGLNWPNFTEEASRELLTGPGLLALPALAYSVARRTTGKEALELGYRPLTQLSNGFMEHIQALPKNQGGDILRETLDAATLQQRAKAQGIPVEQYLAQHQQDLRKAYQNAFRGFLDSRLDDNTLRGTVIESKEIQDRAKSILDTEKMREGYKYGDFWEKWTERYTNVLLDQPPQGADKAALKAFRAKQGEELAKLGQVLDDVLVTGYNRGPQLKSEVSSQLANKANGQKVGKSSLLRSQELKLRQRVATRNGQFETVTKPKAIPEFLEEITRFKDYANRVINEKVAGAGGRGYMESVPSLGNKVLKQLVRKKFLLSAGTTLLGGLYLIMLPRIAQRNESYPGERPAGGGTSAENKPATQAPTAAAPSPANVGFAATPPQADRRFA